MTDGDAFEKRIKDRVAINDHLFGKQRVLIAIAGILQSFIGLTDDQIRNKIHKKRRVPAKNRFKYTPDARLLKKATDDNISADAQATASRGIFMGRLFTFLC